MKQETNNLIELSTAIERLKLIATEHDVKRIKPFRYPIRSSILLELKRPTSIDPTIREAVCTFIKERMTSRKQTDAVLVCATKDRLSMSRRKDKTASAPKVEAKIIISSPDDILRAVDTLFQRLDTLKARSTTDGLKAIIGLGTVNTLEVISEPSKNGSFYGF